MELERAHLPRTLEDRRVQTGDQVAPAAGAGTPREKFSSVEDA